MNFTIAVAVSTVTWSAIFRQFTKNYDLFQDTTSKRQHYASTAGKPIYYALNYASIAI